MLKKPISFLLVLIMLVSCVVSCSKNSSDKKSPDTQNQTTGGQNADLPGDDYETAEYNKYLEEKEKKLTTQYVKEKYASNDMEGYKFRIFGISPNEHYVNFISDTSSEIWYEEDNADVQVHSVFERNVLTEELLNVVITPIWGGTCYDVTDLTKSLIKSGGDEFDIVYNAQFKSLQLAMEAYYYNLYDIDTFDPHNDWWDQQYVDTFTMKNNILFTLTGDPLILDEMAGEVLFYNTQVVENFNLPDPTEYVDDGIWTIEKMMNMAEVVVSDSNGDGVMNDDDTWGLTDNEYALVHFLEGCNIHMTANNEEGMPEVIIENEEFVNAVQYVYEKLVRSPASLLHMEDMHNPLIMIDDRGLFHYDQMGVIFRLREMESNFGLLPMPKLNEEQEKYTSVVNGIWCSTLAVPISAQDFNKIGTILDVWGGFSTDTVNTAMDEVLLGTKLIREKRSRDMLKYIVESREYDWAKDIPWGYPIYNLINEQTAEETFTISSKLQRNIKLIKAQLKRFTYMYK